jgi:type II secretion system protein G
MNSKRGFTLIEMLIVVAIIGILASVVVIGIGPAQQRARDSRRASDLKQIQTALELYYNKNGEYPITARGGQGGEMGWDALTTEITGAGIGVNKVPVDPINSTASKYQYASSGDGTAYVLKATLEQVNDALQKTSLRGTLYGLDCGANPPTTDTDKKKYCVGP